MLATTSSSSPGSFFSKLLTKLNLAMKKKPLSTTSRMSVALTARTAGRRGPRDTDHPDRMLKFVQGKLWTKLTSPPPPPPPPPPGSKKRIGR